MAFQDNNDLDDFDANQPPEQSGNRTFVIVAGILAAIALLAIAGILIYALVILPGRRDQQTEQAATIVAQNTAVAKAITETSAALSATDTPTITPSPIPNTPTPSQTSVLAMATSTRAAAATKDARTATVSALLTQAALTTQTVVSTLGPTSTALPTTGFADDVGLPAMMGIALLLIGVILVSRRLRSA